MFYLSLLRRNHYEKVLTTELQLTLKLLDEGRIFSGIVPRQERGSFVCKHRQQKQQYTSSFIKQAFLKATQPRNMKPLKNEAIAN